MNASLIDRIKAVRAEADAFLDEKARDLAATTRGVPVHVLRNLLTNGTSGCQCRAVLNNSGGNVRENA